MAGYLSEAQSRAGDVVKAGQVMATLDDRDLRLERLKWATQRAKQQREYSEALAKQELAKAQVLRTQIEQAEAQLTLLDRADLALAHHRLPSMESIVSGDLSQQLGAPVERGNILFEVAPLNEYRVVLKVDERDIVAVRPGLSGELVLSSMPNRGFAFLVEKITPVSTAQEGHNFFRVEARPWKRKPRPSVRACRAWLRSQSTSAGWRGSGRVRSCTGCECRLVLVAVRSGHGRYAVFPILVPSRP